MKLLIIAGPYEADRIRRAAVSAGFETVAIEPGESLSGWISATRPDLIVMAPQMVNHDPQVAVAKVRATPRGRVPIFFVGDASDEARFKNLADGFFVRPIAPADLIAQALSRVVPSPDRSGPILHSPSMATPGLDPISGAGASASPPSSGPKILSMPDLKPLVAQGDPGGLGGPTASTAGPAASRRPAGAIRGRTAVGPPTGLLRNLEASIDASLDAEMFDIARDLVREAPPVVANDAVAELRDERSQKTREVDSDVVARGMMWQEGTDAAPGPVEPGLPLGALAEPAAEAPREEVGASAPVESGPIGSPDIAILLGRIHFEKLTGRLTFDRGVVKKTIFFERGAPILARSNLPDDRMGEMLARQGRLSRDQRAQGAVILERTGRRIGGVLVELGALKASELGALVRRHYEEIIYSVFAWPEAGEAPGAEGEWTLGPEAVETSETVRLHQAAPALIMEGIRRKYTAARLLRRLGGGGQVMQLLAVGATTSTTLDEMALSDEERSLVRRFDGVRTLDEIRVAANVFDEVPCGLAWALVALRLAVATRAADATMSSPPLPAGLDAGNGSPAPEVTAEVAAQAASEAASDAAAEAASDAGSGDPAGSPLAPALAKEQARAQCQAIDRARVLARFALVKEGDYFELLGLPREATGHEVRRAHQALTRELSARSLDVEVVAELEHELRAIREVLDEGARVLGDARLRRRYQAHLPVAPARQPE